MYLRSLIVFAVDAAAGIANAVLEALFPEAPDDTMAIADAAGVTVLVGDEDSREWHDLACQVTEGMADERIKSVGPGSDFVAWSMELRAGDRS